MKRLAFGKFQDYMALLVRRKFWIFIPFLVCAIAAATITMLLPKVYVSETLILVEPREVPSDFVKDLVTVSTEDRLRSIQKTILSRTNLLQIIYEFEDSLTELRGLNDEERVARMREDIFIEFQEDRRSGDGVVSFFTISYQSHSPELAQKITSKLADLFIQYDSKTREEQVLGTADFMQNELQKVAADLSVADEQLKSLKERYRYELPEQMQSNLLTLDRLQARAVANEEALDRYFSERQLLERQLSETPQVIIEEAPAGGQTRRAAAPNAAVAEYRQKEKLLGEATARYTDKHPEVIRLRSDLERLRQEIPPEDLIQIEEPETGTTRVTRPNPAYQSLQKQLAEVKTEIEIRKRDKLRIETDISRFNGRVQNTPSRELELTETQRRYDELKTQYDRLKLKLDEAKLAANLENVQKGAQFSIQDRANLPLKPAKPNRIKVLLMGLLASLAVGLAFGVAVDLSQQRIWTQSELEQLFKVPVLIEIPEITTEADLQGKHRKNVLQMATMVALLAASVLTVLLLYASPKLQVIMAQLLGPVVKAVSKLS